MTPLESLILARTQLIEKLVAATLNPAPNYTIEGQNVNMADYFKMLVEGIKDINSLILIFDPYEIRSIA